MVNVNQIHDLVNKHFATRGKVTVDPDSGVVDVEGDIILESKVSQLPVQFGSVSHIFDCSHNRLTSLQGAPDHVGGDCYCHHNKLTSLQGAPSHVVGGFYCNNNQLSSLLGAPRHVGSTFDCDNNKLSSLQGAPDHVGDMFFMSYDPQSPLLRLVMYDKFYLWHGPVSVKQIMKQYAGKGKSAMLNCALDLKKAGFAGNAKW